MPEKTFLKALGPGLLFAGAAVGVSHLVQSTRAGAAYGVGLLVVVLLANVIKYPPLSFGPRYAAATGTSLLQGYRRQGTWALAIYALLTLGTMFTVQAAITVVTAGLAKVTLGVDASLFHVSVGLTVLCAGLLLVGQFRLLDRLIKVVVATLTIATVVATLLVIPRVDFGTFALLPEGLDGKKLLFLAALIGWMPSPIDISIWHSLWTLARRRDSGHAPSMKESKLDFDIGYLGTAFLAVCFVLLGAGVMHGSGTPIPDKAVPFAAQIVGLYTATLGAWAKPLIASCALLVMFSTTLTVIDGFPRALSILGARFESDEQVESDEAKGHYRILVGALAIGSLIVVSSALKSLTTLVDLATTLSFLTAPILSLFNHRAMFSESVPEACRPGPRMAAASVASISVQTGFAAWYLLIRFG